MMNIAALFFFVSLFFGVRLRGSSEVSKSALFSGKVMEKKVPYYMPYTIVCKIENKVHLISSIIFSIGSLMIDPVE